MVRELPDTTIGLEFPYKGQLPLDDNSPQSKSYLIIICIQGSLFWNKENKILLGERHIKCPQCTGPPVL